MDENKAMDDLPEWWDGTPVGWELDEMSYHAESLRTVENRLTSAADKLDEATQPDPQDVDAGASTPVVTGAIAMAQGLGMVTAEVMRQAASNIDATRGAYGLVENTAEGSLRYWMQISDVPDLQDRIRDRRGGTGGVQ